MLKLSVPSIIKPLLIIFENCLNFRTFLDDWKKGNVVPIQKKITNNLSITTILHPCYVYVPKILRSSCFVLFLDL